jgi:prephenate dehydrogenase
VKIAVLGAGRMGRWLAGILAGGHRVWIHDRDPERLAGPGAARILDDLSGLRDLKPDLLVNAVAIRETIAAFRTAEPFLEPGCLLADVTSVKGGLPAYYRVCGFPFVSLHPMFGPTFANVERLSDENVILIAESDPRGKEFFRGLFSGLGLTVHEFGFEEHDRKIAYSLTLPFASTLVFAACLDPGSVPGTTFRKHREIAGGLLSEDDQLLAEILFNPFSLDQLDRVTGRLEFLKHVIRSRDQDEMRRFLASLRENLGRPGTG